MKRFSTEEKLTVVRAWRVSGQSQAAFCAAHPGIAARTLRTWVRACRGPDDSLVRARAVVANAVNELSAVLKAIDIASRDRLANEEHDLGHDAAAAPCRAASADASPSTAPPSASAERHPELADAARPTAASGGSPDATPGGDVGTTVVQDNTAVPPQVPASVHTGGDPQVKRKGFFSDFG